jgi:ribosome maturation factor RimP
VLVSEGISKTGIELELLDLCEKVLRPHGFAVVDVDFHPMGRSLVRVFVERQLRGEVEVTGTNLDDCAEASRLLDECLEHSDLIPGGYDLEVSSPGLDRRLRTLGDFQKSVGKTVQFRFTRKLEEFGLGAKTTAELLDVDGQGLKFATSGKRYEVPWQHLKQANMVWSPDAQGKS